jgi:hypothetical protein
MTRTQNDIGRAFEFSVVEEFVNNGFQTGPLATLHRANFAPYFSAQSAQTQKDFIDASKKFFKWFQANHMSSIGSKMIEGLPDNSGSVVDLIVGDKTKHTNFSLKHNHMALRHNRPHGIPKRCGMKGTPEGNKYLNSVYEIELRMRLDDPATLFNNLTNKRKWMMLLQENCREALEDWQHTHPETVPIYFGFLTGNDRPYYKLILNDRPGAGAGLLIHEFLGASLPTSVAFSYNSYDHLVMKYNNGWELKKRIHNASSRVGNLDLTQYSQSTDWKWDVSLVTEPNPTIYQI